MADHTGQHIKLYESSLHEDSHYDGGCATVHMRVGFTDRLCAEQFQRDVANLVNVSDAPVQGTMLRLEGKPFRCTKCGASVFTRQGDIYSCNGCKTLFEGTA